MTLTIADAAARRLVRDKRTNRTARLVYVPDPRRPRRQRVGLNRVVVEVYQGCYATWPAEHVEVLP